jgi:hypothetical protein
MGGYTSKCEKVKITAPYYTCTKEDIKKGIRMQWNQLLVILEEASNNAWSSMRGNSLKVWGMCAAPMYS